jgi:GNAT superfamily N-acetyltransferase
MEIRALEQSDIEQAMRLVWEVFSEFEAPEYERRGADEFRRYIEPGAVLKRMESGELKLWGGFEYGLITGVIAARPRENAQEKGSRCFDHICLLFVRKEYHRRGIARALFGEAKRACQESGAKEITVNSSPYAAEAYRRLGFIPTEAEKCVNGIRFTPMKYMLD